MNYVSQGSLDTFDQSHKARLNGRAEQFRKLRCKPVCSLRVEKEANYLERLDQADAPAVELDVMGVTTAAYC